MKAITSALYHWGSEKVNEITYNPYPSMNIIHRYRIEGEVQSGPQKDKILCYDPKNVPGYVNSINREWKKLPKGMQDCVFGKFVVTQLLVDGNPYTANQVAITLNMSKDAFDKSWSRGVNRINRKVEL